MSAQKDFTPQVRALINFRDESRRAMNASLSVYDDLRRAFERIDGDIHETARLENGAAAPAIIESHVAEAKRHLEAAIEVFAKATAAP